MTSAELRILKESRFKDQTSLFKQAKLRCLQAHQIPTEKRLELEFNNPNLNRRKISLIIGSSLF